MAFVEHWKDSNTYDEHYIVYYPDKIETYVNGSMTDSKPNLSGLPIHYCGIAKSQYNHFGEPFPNDLIGLIDTIEFLLSKMDDSVTTHSLSPIGVAVGKRIESRIPKEMVGAVLNIEEDGGGFDFATAMLDHDSIKLLLDTLWQQFYAIACIPATSMGQSNIANVSETSLRLLYARMDDKARESIQSLKEGMFKRFECYRKLLALSGQTVSDEDFDTLDISFNVNRPVDTYSLMEELAIQRSMGAISVDTIINLSPYTKDYPTELKRLADEAASGNDADEKQINSALKEVTNRRQNRYGTDVGE